MMQDGSRVDERNDQGSVEKKKSRRGFAGMSPEARSAALAKAAETRAKRKKSAQDNAKESAGSKPAKVASKPKWLEKPQGSLTLKEAVRLKCWQCSNEQKSEVRFCPVKGCGLWNKRPWRNKPKTEKHADTNESGDATIDI